MKHEDIIKEWISSIESIEIDGLRRKVVSKRSNDLGKIINLSAELTDLSDDKEENLDYKSRGYSKFCFEFINIFIEKLKTGEVRNNSNWTCVEFYDNNKRYAYVEYKTFNFIISTDYNKYVELTREKKLKELGL
jgi:hypothetical protein